jgi:hypothetical protein
MKPVATKAGLIDWNSETFRSAVSDNLTTGRFRLVFALDQITEELKYIVEFLNVHTSAGLQVLAVEIGYVHDSGVQITDHIPGGGTGRRGVHDLGRPGRRR